MTCGTCFLLHLATMKISVWKKIAGGRASSSCGFGGEPGLCLGTAGFACAPVLLGFNPVLGWALWGRIQVLGG